MGYRPTIITKPVEYGDTINGFNYDADRFFNLLSKAVGEDNIWCGENDNFEIIVSALNGVSPKVLAKLEPYDQQAILDLQKAAKTLPYCKRDGYIAVQFI